MKYNISAKHFHTCVTEAMFWLASYKNASKIKTPANTTVRSMSSLKPEGEQRCPVSQHSEFYCAILFCQKPVAQDLFNQVVSDKRLKMAEILISHRLKFRW